VITLRKRHLKNKVRYYRRISDTTQEELAEKIGVHRQTIISIEKQKYEPSIGIVLMISRVLNEPVENLFFLLEEKSDNF